MAVNPEHNQAMAELTISIAFAVIILAYVLFGGKKEE
jgi:hypothetical protein